MAEAETQKTHIKARKGGFGPTQAVYKQKEGFQRVNFWKHTALVSWEENQPVPARSSLIHQTGQ